MKARVLPSLTNKEIKILADYTDRQIIRGVTRAQWLMLIACNNALGIGKKRAEKVLEEYEKLVKDFEKYKSDNVADEIILKRIQQIGLEVDKLYIE